MITIQMYRDFQWTDAFTIDFCDPSLGFRGRCLAGYDTNHVLSFIDYPSGTLAGAVSSELPLDWGTELLRQAPSFVFDVVPSGFGRRAISRDEAFIKPHGMHPEVFLLAYFTGSPIGNLRVKESQDRIPGRQHNHLSHDDISRLGAGFVRGCSDALTVGNGAFGAGGEAPKVLVTRGVDGGYYADAMLADSEAISHHLVKYPRNRAGARDQIILRSECQYYRALQALGLDTIGSEGLEIVEGEVPALWMPRFDRSVVPDGVCRHAVESLYSMMGIVTPGSYLNHTEIFRRLSRVWVGMGQQAGIVELAQQYVLRDLLNVVLGNSDNHGRNTSIMRDVDGVRLAPIYDLAPMVMDDDGITRLTRWSREIEVGSVIDWRKACDSLGEWVNAENLYEWLRAECKALMALPDLLTDTGLPAQTMAHPGVWVGRLPRYFEMTGLR